MTYIILEKGDVKYPVLLPEGLHPDDIQTWNGVDRVSQGKCVQHGDSTFSCWHKDGCNTPDDWEDSRLVTEYFRFANPEGKLWRLG